MHTIFQIDRYLLRLQLQRASWYIRGNVLDVGSGDFLRYRDLFDCEAYDTLEPDAAKHPTIVGSAEKIPVPDVSYDTIISTQVLEHLPHPVQAAGEMFRVLKPGGFAVVTVPQWNELHEEPHDYWRYTNFGLERLFMEAGFGIELIEPRGGFFAFLGQAVARYLIDALGLYESAFWNMILFGPLKVFGHSMLLLDRIFASAASRKHTIGWLLVVRKPVL